MKYFTRRLIKSEDLNGAGTLFGGRAMAWIDEEAAICAMGTLERRNIVTKIISEIDFKAPARLGDIIEIGVEVIKIGITSITISCNIRNITTLQDILTVNKIVFVSVDKDGKPVPHGKEYV